MVDYTAQAIKEQLPRLITAAELIAKQLGKIENHLATLVQFKKSEKR